MNQVVQRDTTPSYTIGDIIIIPTLVLVHDLDRLAGGEESAVHFGHVQGLAIVPVTGV